MPYNRPGKVTQWSNQFFGWLASLGAGPRKMVKLEVRGRKSGRIQSTAVNVVSVDGQRYLVAPRGNTHWARNARAAGGEAAIVRRKRSPVRLEELPVGDRAPIIQAYLKANAWVTQREFGISPKAPLSEFQRIAPGHPVFRIVDTSS